MQLITIAQASAATGIPRSTINLWIRQGLIKGTSKVGNQWTLPANWKTPTPKRGPKFTATRRPDAGSARQSEP